jgi:hypothetical protein
MGKTLGWVSGVLAVALTTAAGAMVSNCGDDLPPMPGTINGTTNPSAPTPQTSDAAASDGGSDGG